MRPLSRSIRCQRTVHVQVAVTVTGDWYFLRRRHCRPDRRWSGPTRRAAASHRSSGPIFEGWSRHRKQLKRIRACPASSVTATRNELHWFPSIVSGTPPSPSLLTLATAPAAAAVTVAVMTPTATATFDLCIHNIITYMTAVTCLRLSMSTNQVIASSYSSCFKTVAVEAAVGLPVHSHMMMMTMMMMIKSYVSRRRYVTQKHQVKYSPRFHGFHVLLNVIHKSYMYVCHWTRPTLLRWPLNVA